MKKIIQKLTAGEILTKDEAKETLLGITNEQYNDAQVTAFLTVYMMRPITAQELNGFREALLEKAVKVDLGTTDALDLCGTGGDGKDTFNISTLAALVAAGAGYTVIKHGNYSVSSSCGSSDVLEACGYTLTNDEETLRKQLIDGNFCYLHAPLFHPSMKAVGPIRKQLEMKTFFNLLGPLVNPVQPRFQLTGVYDLEVADLYNEILSDCREGYRVIHSVDGYDEISLTGDYYEYKNGSRELISPSLFGMDPVKPEDLYGGETIEESAKIFMNVLEGNGTEAQNNAVLINAASAIMTMSVNLTPVEAMAGARASLFNGEALRALTAASGVK